MSDQGEDTTRGIHDAPAEHRENNVATPSSSTPDDAAAADAAAAASAATKRRREIQSIMRDATLTDLERRLKIQQLMDGSSSAAAAASASSVTSRSESGYRSNSDGGIDSMLSSLSIHNNNDDNNDTTSINNIDNANNIMQHNQSITSSENSNKPAHVAVNEESTQEAVVSCIHYERKCNIVAPCCQRTFGCRLCHDDIMSHPSSTKSNNNNKNNNATTSTTSNTAAATKCKIPMDRYAISHIICKACHTLQSSKTNVCLHCQISFAEYHCSICNIWMSNTKSPFHCSKCGMCRVGGSENYKHCDLCGMCLSITVYESHHCMPDKYKNSCPVCREDMFSSRLPPQELPCGHAIHSHCFRNLATFDNRCPICKKTVVSSASMMQAWNARARDIELQPMPVDLARIVNIACNDCEAKSENCHWHFLGVQCPNCKSFNTVVECVISSSS